MSAGEQTKLNLAAKLIHEAKLILQEVQPNLERPDDVAECRRIITELSWANENCTVMGRHQIGEALDDTMGR